jgi:hypothetical protein
LDRTEPRRRGIERGVELGLVANVGGKSGGILAYPGDRLFEQFLIARRSARLSHRDSPAIAR